MYQFAVMREMRFAVSPDGSLPLGRRCVAAWLARHAMQDGITPTI
jgi:hypothetical protein